MEVTPRMRTIIECISKDEYVADIGCDHGIISFMLSREKRAQYIYACDISAKSLKKAKKLAEDQDVDNIEAIQSDGLSALRGRPIDSIVISGMGGLLIRDILGRELDTAHKARKLVLGPQGNEYDLRLFLYQHGFSIFDEHIIKDDQRYYQIIIAGTRESSLPDEIYLQYGYFPIMRKDSTQKEFLTYKLNELESIIKKAKRGKDTTNYIQKKMALKIRIEEVLATI